MKKITSFFLLLFVVAGIQKTHAQKPSRSNYDLVIYGGTSAGVIAAYTAAKLHKSVILIEPGKHLGGMSSGGLGLTDIGNKYAISGLALDFYRKVGAHYGKFEQWIFEPHVAEEIFQNYIKSAKIEVLYQSRITSAIKDGNQIREIRLENSFDSNAKGSTIAGKVFIDCSYEGDLMAKSGVSYTVGRESNSTYQESFNGVQLKNGHQLPENIDPYRIKGDKKSGLIWGITQSSLAPEGTGDKKVQAYNFRICLSSDPNNQIQITKPINYNPDWYELLLRQMEKRSWKSLQDVFIWSGMPNGKTDINNRNGFSTDMIGMNWAYPDADYKQRAEIWNAHVDYTKGLLYFVGHDQRVPEHIRKEMSKWGYPKDEYTDNNNWSHQLYVREARRMIGQLVMTQHHCQGIEKVDDGVGMAAYTMDSHNCDRLVVDGMVKNEGNVEEGGFGPYPISYRAITPKRQQAANLLVPVCLSASHIAYGSIRMEPVFMVLAQSAALAAVEAINQNLDVQQIDVAKVQAALKANPLMDGRQREIIVDNNDAKQVLKSGKWQVQTHGGYGPDYYIADPKDNQTATLRYKPTITNTGKYELFIYYPKQKQAASTTRIKVFDGKKENEVQIEDAKVNVVGQTSGEWVSLGHYDFQAEKNAYVELSTKGADASITADAILLVPGKK